MTIVAETQTPREPRATYQGIPCASWRAARTPGFESDAYEVVVPAASVREVKFEAPKSGYYAPAGGGAQGSAAGAPAGALVVDGSAPALGSKLQIRGDLVMDDGMGGVVTIEGLYVRDDGIEVVDSGDDEAGPALVRLHLVDIRYFWASRGELWGRYNILLPDGTYDRGTIFSGGGDAPGSQPGSTEVRGGFDEPWTLREIVEKIARRLPGAPAVKAFPKSAEKRVPVGLDWRGANPATELERLCGIYGLTLTLDLRSDIRITDSSEALPQDSRSGEGRTIGDATLPAARWWRTIRRAFRHRPEAVRVIGPRVVREVRVDNLEAVGYARKKTETAQEDGTILRKSEVDETQLVTAGEAAASYGLTMTDLGRLVLQPQHAQARFFQMRGLGDIERISVMRWAFRMFRIPRPSQGFLPILPERAVTYVDAAAAAEKDPRAPRPAPLPPLVEAETFEERRYTQAQIDAFARAAGGPGAAGGAGGGGPEDEGGDTGPPPELQRSAKGARGSGQQGAGGGSSGGAGGGSGAPDATPDAPAPDEPFFTDEAAPESGPRTDDDLGALDV